MALLIPQQQRQKLVGEFPGGVVLRLQPPHKCTCRTSNKKGEYRSVDPTENCLCQIVSQVYGKTRINTILKAVTNQNSKTGQAREL